MDQISAKQPELNKSTYGWSVRVFRILRKMLSVNIKLHHIEGQIKSGDIFLFNHFSRFETFIPQYLIHEATGDYCYSVAHSEFFADGDSTFSNYLYSVGVLPHDDANLFARLAKEILHGRKVISFPEGGMVKDRQVIDEKGRYRIFSRTANIHRKQHSGAAVLAMGLDAFKTIVRYANRKGDNKCLEMWAEQLEFDDVSQLLKATARPTEIIPSNITFYPLRVNDNILRRGSELLSKGLSLRASEELLIEGNILLKDTDMDVRLGDPVHPRDYWRWWERKLGHALMPSIQSLEAFFQLTENPATFKEKILANSIAAHAASVRDSYMVKMYEATTVNLSHVASSIVMQLMMDNIFDIDHDTFHRMVYLTIKKIQSNDEAHLHRNLKKPIFYTHLADGHSEALEQFLRMAGHAELIQLSENCYHFQPKLLDEHAFDEVRKENPIAVYSNETEPLQYFQEAIKASIIEAESLNKKLLAAHLFDDEQLTFSQNKTRFSQDEYDKLNKKETATADASPFLLFPAKENGRAVITVHGFLASPVEVRGLADKMVDQGYIAVGPRLAGHGTSPADLRTRSWEEWLENVNRAIDIARGYADDLFIAGFSTGAALTLLAAANSPKSVRGIAAISTPIAFQDKSMMFVSMLHSANQLFNLITDDGLKAYVNNTPEHADINYCSIPIHGLNELKQLIPEVKNALPKIKIPTLILQGDEDPIVKPDSAQYIYDALQTDTKSLEMITSKRHGIVYEDINNTQEKIIQFFDRIAEQKSAPAKG